MLLGRSYGKENCFINLKLVLFPFSNLVVFEILNAICNFPSSYYFLLFISFKKYQKHQLTQIYQNVWIQRMASLFILKLLLCNFPFD
jgi:hypothetical protein